jgi:hypothetical protein
VPGAVHFNGATKLHLASVATTNNAFFGFAGWFKANWNGGNYTSFIFDPGNAYGPASQGPSANRVTFYVNDLNGVHSLGISQPTSSLVNNSGWQHFIAGANSSGSGTIVMYFDEAKSVGTITNQAPFTTSTNGLELFIGSDNTTFNYIGDMAELSIWPGVNFLTGSDISVTTRRLFVDGGGNAVDPNVAIAALGTPAVMLSGDSSGFRLNTKGSAGAFSVAAGTLTNASTTPP